MQERSRSDSVGEESQQSELEPAGTPSAEAQRPPQMSGGSRSGSSPSPPELWISYITVWHYADDAGIARKDAENFVSAFFDHQAVDSTSCVTEPLGS